MIPNALLITGVAVNFPKFLALSTQAIGYSPALAVDKSPFAMAEATKFVSCLAAMVNKSAAPGLCDSLLSHVSSSVLIAADMEDMTSILQATEMPFVVVDTVVRGVQVAVVSGTLQQWKAAVKRGTEKADTNVRSCFETVKGVFVAEGMDTWKEPLRIK